MKFKAMMQQQFHGSIQNPDVESHTPLPDVEMSYEWGPQSPRLEMFVKGQSLGIPCVRDEHLSHPSPNPPEAEILPPFPDLTVTEEFPAEYEAGRTYGRQKPQWQQMHDDHLQGLHDRWGGFGKQGEWELARWMMKSGLSQGEIDKFLKLRIASGQCHLYEQSCH